MLAFEKLNRSPSRIHKTRSNLNMSQFNLNQGNSISSSRLFNNNQSHFRRTSFFQQTSPLRNNNSGNFYIRKQSFLSRSKYSEQKQTTDTVIQNKLTDFLNYKESSQKKFESKYGTIFNDKQVFQQDKAKYQNTLASFTQNSSGKLQQMAYSSHLKKSNFDQFQLSSNKKSNDLFVESNYKNKFNQRPQNQFKFTNDFKQFQSSHQYQFKPTEINKREKITLQSSIPTQSLSKIQGLISLSQLQSLESALQNCSSSEYKQLPIQYLRAFQSLASAVRSKQTALY